MLKRLLNHPAIQAVLCRIVALYVRLVWRTGRWHFEGEEAPKSLSDAGKPLIVAFWHGRLFMAPFALHGDQHGASVMISTHRDGRMISRVVGLLGVSTVAGSTSRGGLTALRQAMRVLRDGNLLGITPDGPRGPRMRASEGVVALARHTGAPIFPLSYSTSRRKVLGSWDRFLLPLPFSRGVFVWGPAITVAPDADSAAMEQARLVVESALNAASERADTLSGQPVIQPAADAILTPASAE